MEDRCPVDHRAAAAPAPAGFRVGRLGGFAASAGFAREPFRLLDGLPARGDLVLTRVFGIRVALVTHPALVDAILRDAKGTWVKDRLSQRAADVFGEGLLLSEGETWRRQRRLLNPGLAAARFDGFARTMRDRAALAVARWPARGELDAAAELAHLTLDVAVRTLFGADLSDAMARRVADAFSAVSDFYASPLAWLPFEVPRWLPLPVLRRHRRAVAELDAVVEEIVRDRRATGGDGDDLLGMLLAARDEEGGLTDREVRDQAVTFLVAGHETTALSLTFALFELGRSPALRARLAAEVAAAPAGADAEAFPFAAQVLRESLRLYPPAYEFGRENIREVTLAGVTLPAGTLLLVPPWTLHRDPRWHRAPLEFLPDRWTADHERTLPPGAYLPFGLGPRKCVGVRFAMMEGVLLLAAIARSHDFVALDGALPPLQAAITCRPMGPVRLRVEARAAAASP